MSQIPFRKIMRLNLLTVLSALLPCPLNGRPVLRPGIGFAFDHPLKMKRMNYHDGPRMRMRMSTNAREEGPFEPTAAAGDGEVAAVTGATAERLWRAIESVYPASMYASRRVLARDAALQHAAATRPTATAGTIIPLAGDQLVYGEFDLEFFERLLAEAAPQPGESFVDCGSGMGRVVLAAALLRPKLGNCHGIEILPELHSAAIKARAKLEEVALQIAPCEYSCMDLFGDDAAAALAAADIVFCYAVTWDRDEKDRLTSLSRLLSKRLRAGSRVLTVGVRLLPKVGAVQFQQIATLRGANDETGNDSVGYVFRVERECESVISENQS